MGLRLRAQLKFIGEIGLMSIQDSFVYHRRDCLIKEFIELNNISIELSNDLFINGEIRTNHKA
jgi:hypothetical protein